MGRVLSPQGRPRWRPGREGAGVAFYKQPPSSARTLVALPRCDVLTWVAMGMVYTLALQPLVGAGARSTMPEAQSLHGSQGAEEGLARGKSSERRAQQDAESESTKI